jgi:NAD(P)-dependent dehydrogenase (short-subunit alcohol dehydrogenase family)
VIDLSGRVAVVTGAGRGIGRAHALLLASRGAAVVVNDLGVQPRGSDPDTTVAAAVVAEIWAMGGRAVASTASVASRDGGEAIVQTALDAFGRVDLLVHNAGVVTAAPFVEQPIEEVRRTLDVHLLGAWHVGQPAWRDMASRGYGRIVLTSSMAQFGHPGQGAYAAAKAGVIGLVRSLAHEASTAGLDIRVNAVCPFAGTRLAREETRARWQDLMDPANVAGVVAYLLSDECALNGQIVHAGGSHVALGVLGQTHGWVKGRTPVTPEDVRDHLDRICDADGMEQPPSAHAQMALVESIVQSAGALGAPARQEIS